MALFLFVEVSHCKHLGEKQPRRRVMKNLFEMRYMTHSLAQFPSGFCAELSLCPKATGVEFETTKDCHSYYYWSGIVSQANMELSSGRDSERFEINWLESENFESSLRNSKWATSDSSFSSRFSGGSNSRPLVSPSSLNCSIYSLLFTMRASRRMFSNSS